MSDKHTLKIVCEELVAMPVGMGMIQHIIFNPTEETLDAISDASKNEDAFYSISVTDNGGNHTTSRMHRIIKTRKTRNVLQVVTSEG